MKNVVVFEGLNQLQQNTEEISNLSHNCVDVQLLQKLTWDLILFSFVIEGFCLFSDEERKDFDKFDSAHT